MTQPVWILGSGGHAKVLLEALLASDARILGMLDPAEARLGADIWGVKVMGDDAIVADYETQAIRLVNGVGSVASTEGRRSVFERFKQQGYSFRQVLHPSAFVSRHATLEEGTQIMAGAVVQADCRIGRNVLLNTRAIVEHDCILGDHVHVASGAILAGGVQVDEGAHIGAGAVLKQGVRVGKSSCVGAGAVVICDVPAGTTVVGVPAKVVSSRG